MAAPIGLGFATTTLDRADVVRKSPDAIAAARNDPAAMYLPMWRLQPFVLDGSTPSVAILGAAAGLALAGAEPAFLGLDGGRPLFAIALPEAAPPDERFVLHGLGRFQELRQAAPGLDISDLERAGLARTLLAWSAEHRFCARCGAPSRSADGGWRRVCDACGKEHFPRIDPVAIIAIEHEGRTLIGRQAGWPPGVWSCLAGFIEPGETVEAGAAREAFEEAGVRLVDVRYRFSQPWPFPSSLMIGVSARTLDARLTVDASELEAAIWAERDVVAAMLDGRHPEMRAPPPLAIAHHLLRGWVEGWAD